MRRYKGIELLCNVIRSLLNTKYSLTLKFIFAGDCHEKVIKKTLNNLLFDFPYNIKIYYGHIEKSHVQEYFNSCDIVVCPYRSISTSGSAILAFSFKKPIIAPRLGNIINFPDNTGYYYSADNIEGLKYAIIDAINNNNLSKEMGIRGYKFIKNKTWYRSAKATVSLYKSVLSMNL